MKRLALLLILLLAAAATLPKTRADEVNVDLFYNNLGSYGQWIQAGDYGYVFQPDAEVADPNWRPYADGYWAQTNAGWTWVSYEDFGWATYHYGRWTRLQDYGWVWVPGTTWGPAWVSWRTGGDYVGWAPLPPETEQVVYEGRAITGHVDVEFDIGPSYYNFVDVRYIGEPVLVGRLIEPERNVTIITRTVNVTNITYNHSSVYLGGPDYNRINAYSQRPIQHLELERSTSVAAAAGQSGNLNRVQGNRLMVTAPAIQRAEHVAPPKTVKATVAQPKVDHGWNGVKKAQLQAQYKKESAQHVPPPTIPKHAATAANVEAEKVGHEATPAPAKPVKSAHAVKAEHATTPVSEETPSRKIPHAEKAEAEHYPSEPATAATPAKSKHAHTATSAPEAQTSSTHRETEAESTPRTVRHPAQPAEPIARPAEAIRQEPVQHRHASEAPAVATTPAPHKNSDEKKPHKPDANGNVPQ